MMKTIKCTIFGIFSFLLLSSVSLTLTSCGDDDDSPKVDLSLYQQWLMDDPGKVYWNYPYVLNTFTDICFDLARPGIVIIFARMKVNNKWVQWQAYSSSIEQETETTGTITYGGEKIKYEIDTNLNNHSKKPILILHSINKITATFHPTSGVHSEGEAPIEE